MMTMTRDERHAWLDGSRRDNQRISEAVSRGAYGCDSCGAPSIAIGHKGTGTPVVVACHPCFTAALASDRAARPSRDEMVRRVNAALNGEG